MLKWRVGDVRITQIVELTSTTIGAHILPQATPERLAEHHWMRPFVRDGKPLLSIHMFVIESQGETLVVDTCIGNDKDRVYKRWNKMQTDFMDRFRQAGFHEQRVDGVMCTHLHVDHVGWNTRLVEDQWVPTFGNARYFFAREEFAHWSQEPQEYGPVFEDSVQPIVDAGLAQVVEMDHRVTDEVWFEPTPGHTPGHVSVHIASRGEEAVITGDMIHHPCQIAHPEWSSTADEDQAQSAQTRHDFLGRYADRPVLVLGTHFAGPTAGHVVVDDGHYRLDY